MGSVVVVDFPAYVIWLHQESEFASITSCKAEWLKLAGASCPGAGPEVVTVDPPILDNLHSYFERDSG